MEYSINVKMRNYLDKVNNAVKKIADEYYMTPSGIIVPTDTGKKITRGRHFSLVHDIEKLQEAFKVPETKIVKMYPLSLYTAVKDNKKTISGIKIEEDIGFISGNDVLTFGKVISEDSSDTFVRYKDYAKETIQTLKEIEMFELNPDTIEMLVGNHLIPLTKGDFHVRITKEIFPHISLKTPVHIGFVQKENPSLFELIVKVKKDEVFNFHVYTCIHFKGDVQII